MDLLHFVNGSSRSTQATSSFQSESLVVLSKPCLLSTSICQETSWMQSIILPQEASTFAKRKLKQPTTVECTTGTYHSICTLRERNTTDRRKNIYNLHLIIVNVFN